MMFEAVARAGASPPADLPPEPQFFQFSADDALTSLLTASGFGQVRVQTVGFAHPVGSVEELWTGLIRGTVRGSALWCGNRRRYSARSGARSTGLRTGTPTARG
jgi:hypothetical protein